MNVITPPESFDGHGTGKRVFVAGGITDCPNWQEGYVEQLRSTHGILFNPRRADFNVKDPNAARDQIEWEFKHLRKAHAVSFWFPSETLCPIVLYELGAWSMTDKKIFVGCHTSYKRRYDVVMQTSLVRPDVVVVQSVVELANQVKRWIERG